MTRQRLHDRWRKTSLPNKLLIASSFIAAAAVVAYAVETYFLWKATQAAADAANLSAKAALAAVAESKRQFDLLQKRAASAAEEERNRFALSQRLAQEQGTTQQELSRQSLDASRQALEMTQRAHVTVMNIPDLDITVKPTSIVVAFRNSGTLPATNLRAVAQAELRYTPPPDAAAAAVQVRGPVSRIVLAAGDACTLPLVATDGFRQDQITAIQSKAQTYYLYGLVSYFDGFHNRRTGFCAFLDPSKKSWNECPNNNWVD